MIAMPSSPLIPSEVEGSCRAQPRPIFSAALEGVSRLRSTRAGLGFLALTVMLAPALAQAGARQEATVIMPENPRQAEHQDEIGYADAIVAGDMVYLSGVIAFRAKPDEAMGASYDRAFRQMGATLRRAGVGWDDVVDITSYHTDANGQIGALARVKKRYIRAPHPAWTAVQVAGLLGERGITEIKLVARKPAAAAQ